MNVTRNGVGAVILCLVLSVSIVHAQSGNGSIKGRVTDSTGAVLPGATVTLSPKGGSGVTDTMGEYAIVGLPAGDYTVSVNYVGFKVFTKNVSLTAGQTARVDATLEVRAVSSEILVTVPRSRGEAEQINRQRTADNIVQVLSAEVITSLPNANIADAVGRLPSVTLERDEGEGKYVQIRGTEPRLSNVTIDGVNVPSPESGVRQIKLDTIASDLVESVEINKTLQANMDGDGIGGSVNLRTKTAEKQPVVMLGMMGGYTPIIGGRGITEYDGTAGKRFGADKKVGVLLSGTYDYNGRGINDIEPSPTVTSVSPHYDSMDLRDYQYYRKRWGVSGTTDYRPSSGTNLSLRGFYSTFKNWGQKWVYSLNDGDTPAASVDWRRPETSVGNLAAAGHHIFGASWLTWDASGSRGQMLGGSGGANFRWNSTTPNCVYDPDATTDVNVPQFSASCYTPGPTNVQDNANYKLTSWLPPANGESTQWNVQGSAAFGKNYHLAARLGTLEFGGKVRNGRKDNNTYSTTYTTKSGVTIPTAPFGGSFADPNYYSNRYPWPSNNADYEQIQNYVTAHPDQFIVTGGALVPSKSTYDLTERVTAGYVMNTLDLSARARLITGVRVEATHVDTLSYDASTKQQTFEGGGNYTDVLPSASLRFALSEDSNMRLAYSRALSRPNPSDITKAAGLPNLTQNPPTISLGNPDLAAEHGDNIDVLFEEYLHSAGMITAGYFFKHLTDPIIATQTRPTSGPYAGYLVSQPGNAGSATLQGFEIAYQQHWGFLPGFLAGMGLSANYGYTTSVAHGIPLRTDSPPLLRQAPHTWNISPTYDRGRLSLRVGMSFNAANIFAYQYQDLNSDGSPVAPGDLTAGGATGPGGDNYLYSHFQLDAQATVRLARTVSLVVSGLNLNDEVFGFYNGSPQYVVQREFYRPTFAFGIRFNPSFK